MTTNTQGYATCRICLADGPIFQSDSEAEKAARRHETGCASASATTTRSPLSISSNNNDDVKIDFGSHSVTYGSNNNNRSGYGVDDEMECVIQPCMCRGTMSYAHPSCLQTWILTISAPSSTAAAALAARNQRQVAARNQQNGENEEAGGDGVGARRRTAFACEVCGCPYNVRYRVEHDGVLSFLTSLSSPRVVRKFWMVLAYCCACVTMFFTLSATMKAVAFGVMLFCSLGILCLSLRKPLASNSVQQRFPRRFLSSLVPHVAPRIEHSYMAPLPIFCSLGVLIILLGYLILVTAFVIDSEMYSTGTLLDFSLDLGWWDADLTWQDTDGLCVLGGGFLACYAIALWLSCNVWGVLLLLWQSFKSASLANRHPGCAGACLRLCVALDIRRLWVSASKQQRCWLTVTCIVPLAVSFFLVGCRGKLIVMAFLVAFVLGMISLHALCASDTASKATLVLCIFGLVVLFTGILSVFGFIYSPPATSQRELRFTIPPEMLYSSILKEENSEGERSPSHMMTVVGSGDSRISFRVDTNPLLQEMRGPLWGRSSYNGCKNFPPEITPGSIIVVGSGGCPALVKLRHAIAAGASAIVLPSSPPRNRPIYTVADFNTSSIPVICAPFTGVHFLLERCGSRLCESSFRQAQKGDQPRLPGSLTVERFDYSACKKLANVKPVSLLTFVDKAHHINMYSDLGDMVLYGIASEMFDGGPNGSRALDCEFSCEGATKPVTSCSAAPPCNLFNFCKHGDNSVCGYSKLVIYFGFNGGVIVMACAVFSFSCIFASCTWLLHRARRRDVPHVNHLLQQGDRNVMNIMEDVGNHRAGEEEQPLLQERHQLPLFEQQLLHAPVNAEQGHADQILPPEQPPHNRAVPSDIEGELWLLVMVLVCYCVGAMAAGLRGTAWERAVILLSSVFVVFAIAISRLVTLFVALYNVWKLTGEGLTVLPHIPTNSVV